MIITRDSQMWVTPPQSGCIVETKSGLGKTKNGDRDVNGKIPVYLDNGGKVLCSPDKIKLIGYYD